MVVRIVVGASVDVVVVDKVVETGRCRCVVVASVSGCISAKSKGISFSAAAGLTVVVFIGRFLSRRPLGPFKRGLRRFPDSFPLLTPP